MVDATQSLPMDRAPRLPVFGTVGRSFSVFASAPILFLAGSVVVALPGLLRILISGPAATQKFTSTSVVVLVAYLLILYLVQTAMTYAAGRAYEGEVPSFGESFAVGLRRYLPMLGVSILIMLAVYIGMILLIVPGVILACVFAVGVPVCALESRGPVESLRRSAALTKGARWRILGIYALFFIPIIAISLLDTFVLLKGGHLIAFTVVSQLVSLIYIPISIILGAVIYVELRRLKENIGVASIFD